MMPAGLSMGIQCVSAATVMDVGGVKQDVIEVEQDVIEVEQDVIDNYFLFEIYFDSLH